MIQCSLDLWHHAHCIYDKTAIIYDITPSEFMTSHQLYLPSHPLYRWHHTHCIYDITYYTWHHTHFIYGIKPTLSMTSHPLYLWYKIHCIYDITSIIYDIKPSIWHHTHFIYDIKPTVCRTLHPLYLWHITHYIYDITFTVFMTSHPLYMMPNPLYMTPHPLYDIIHSVSMTSHLLCLWHLTHYIWHHIHCIYDITCTMSMISHPQYLSHHITSHHIMKCPAKDANVPSETAVACNISHLCLHLKKRLPYLLISLPHSCKISLKCLFSGKPQPWPMQGRYSYEEGAFNFLGKSLSLGIFWTR